ncbi:acetate kinase [Candidatus Uhrbacteria bacterium]|nr:acetate kinase [Candidatus Uhrbacteria bacterium]
MYFIINSGSSSLKFKVFGPKLEEKASGIVERIGLADSFLKYAVGGAEKRRDFSQGVDDHKEALRHVFAALADVGINAAEVSAFGHRVVHGGEDFTEPTVITAAVLKKLQGYNRLAPLHNPANLMGIDACRQILPKAPNVAVFDTAFYKTLPDFAFVYALPWEYYKKHKIRKYGFHGISHRFVAEEAARRLGKPFGKLRIVSCHLGSGSSVTAVKFGKAVDTTMGFTPLEGLTMSTRCGDIDPAIPLYLMRTFKMSEAEVDDVLNKKSGLLGVSGYKDLREVMAAAGIPTPGFVFKKKVSAEGKYRARLAIEIFCYDAARYVGQFAAIMGGADAVVFTAGIGERSEYIRKKVMVMVSLPGRPKVMVVPTNEELMIARETKKILAR